MVMGFKERDVVSRILLVIGVIVLQVPFFIAIWKLAESSPSLKVDFQSESTSSSFSQNTSCFTATMAAAAFRPLSFANHPFVLFSVYRDTLNSFYVVGITSVIVRSYENDQPVYKCEWVPGNKSNIGSDRPEQTSQEEALVTEAKLLYVSVDENKMVYVPAIVNCTFSQSVGADGEGGLLRLHLSRGPSKWGPDYAVEDVFREKLGEVSERNKSWLEQDSESESVVEPDWPYKYAFCGPPLFGTAYNSDWTLRWLAYHHYLWEGKAHFYFYVAEALNKEARQMLEPWMKAGLLTIVEALGGEVYPSWYRNQVVFINDCIYRTRSIAQWSVFHDLDELLYVPAPHTLASVIEEHRDKPWMTFGSFPFSTDHCTATTHQEEKSPDYDQTSQQQKQFGWKWQLERLLWRSKLPECMYEEEDPWMCVAAGGRRKYLVNPRKVFLSGIHKVLMPEEGGVNFNASVARVHHFRGITDPQMKVCNCLVSISGDCEQPDPLLYELDDAIASLVPRIRDFAGPLLIQS